MVSRGFQLQLVFKSYLKICSYLHIQCFEIWRLPDFQGTKLCDVQ